MAHEAKILVGLDGSPMEREVLAAAREQARTTQSKLVLFRALTLPVDLPAAVYQLSPDRAAQLIESMARTHLDALAAEVPAAQLGGVRVEFGTPWRAVCEAAIDENADMVVIGSHGYHGLDRLLGTTAAKIVNHIDRSVLVVRPRGVR